VTRLYDAEIASNDECFGALLAELKRHGLYEQTMIVVMSDHGEELYDHGGWTHGKTLFGEVLDVPLIIRLPGGQQGRTVDALAQHVDLLPTVAEIAGLPLPAPGQGTSLVPLLQGQSKLGRDHKAVAHLDLDRNAATCYLDSEWKVIVRLDQGVEGFPQLYNRIQDPEENTDLGPEHPELARFFASLLKRRETEAAASLEPSQLEGEVPSDIQEQLRALGYLE
jgi:arylsulfatase A-like enzyme